jgi:hypothetical protein
MVCQCRYSTDRITVYAYGSCRLGDHLRWRVVRNVNVPLALAADKLNATDEPDNWTHPHHRKNNFLEEGWNTNAISLYLDNLSFVPAYRDNDV